ncbi:unnamed protein product [Leptidea sinapis]|uniref:Tryptophan synthase beta chain-like PALP domain-containing protein n=1 Tax=Leptidea sinapis TaxID=189913 RepID=A0A5E4Q1R6_9NEOP|nr:unnamed protein product [Leptidea sinapis]
MAEIIQEDIKSSALELIGNTPLLALDRLHPGPGRLLVKCEFMNPGGSIKCRSSYNMIQKARERGTLKPGGMVIEMTSGNQGSGLAVVSAVLGHELVVHTSSEALQYQKLIGSKEGLYVGYTSGANVAAAAKLLNSGKLPKDARVVTILCDTGLKYP